MKISPELIPHNKFHTGAWLLSVERPDWYYYRKKRNANRITNKRFYKSVDNPLKPLVRFLHRKGIKTTPSCSGHHFSERNLEKMFDNMELDKNAIQNGGLQLKDVETGKLFLYCDKNYKLPWSKEKFIEELSIYQQKGVIGLRLERRKKVRQEILNLRIEGATIEEKDNIIFIYVVGESGNNTAIWKKVTRQLKKIIH